MSQASCPSDDEIARYVEDSLGGEARDRLRLHIRSCARCRPIVLDAVRLIDDEPTDPRVQLPRERTAGRYRLGAILGMGAMGVVYAAHDPELGRQLAVKLLRPRADVDDDRDQRFVREAKSLARVVHPNVVTIFDVGQEDEQVFIAMELVAGGTLRDWMQQGNHTFEATVRLFEAIARGLNAVHKAGLVHRDFKPENVLIDREGRPRVTDFGLARGNWQEDSSGRGRIITRAGLEVIASGTLTATGAVMGTPAYMAPEQHRAALVDGRADIFSYCVVFWEALFGVRPFAGSSLAELSASIQDQRVVEAWPRPRPPRGVSLLRPILLRGLRADPSERWATFDELLAQLHRLLQPPRRTGRLLGALGGLLLATSLVSGLAVWRAQEQARCQQNPLASAWSPRQRQQLVTAWGAAGQGDRAELLARQLDTYAARLATVRSGACEATYVRRDKSEFVFDAQMECLAGLGLRLRLLAEELTRQPGLAEAADVLGRLDKPEICLDRKSRTERRTAAQQRSFEALSLQLGAAHNALAFGRWNEAQAAYARLTKEAEAAGEATLAAQALVGRAQAALGTERPEAAVALFDEGIATALYAEDYMAAAAGYATLLDISNAIGTDFGQSERIGHLGAWAIERGGLSDHYRYHWRRALGEAYGINQRPIESELLLRAALAVTADPYEQADVQMILAQVLTDRCDYAGARAMLQAAEANTRGRFVDARQTMVVPLGHAYLEYATGNPAEAVRQQQLVLRRADEQLGAAGTPIQISGLADLSVYQRAAGDLEAAHQSATRAYQKAIATTKEGDSYRHQAMLQLASIENDLGHATTAHALLRPIVAAVLGPSATPSAAQIRLHLELARALVQRADATERKSAQQHLANARQIGSKLPRLGEIRELLDRVDRLAAELRR